MRTLPAAEPLSEAAFAPYGWVLRRDAAGEAFQVVHTDGASRGWRVALLEVPAGPLRRVHRHPDSEECFAPLAGAPWIVVGTAPSAVRLFRLDAPVCVRRGVWHEVIADAPARVFIAENAGVAGEDHRVTPPLPWRAALGAER